MSEEEVVRLATAIAQANGHDDTAGYSAKVVAAWKESAPARRSDDVKDAITDARQKREE